MLFWYSDAAFAHSDGVPSQFEWIIFLIYSDDSFAPIAFKSYKSYVVTRSTLAAEDMAFDELLDEVLSY